MKYTIFKITDGYLDPVSKDVEEELLIHYGDIKKEIYNNYDKEKATVVGYILSNGFYVLKDGLK